MTRAFFYHPDRSKDVLHALVDGSLVAGLNQLVEDKFMPLVDEKNKPILGWWVDVDKLFEFKPYCSAQPYAG